MNSNDVFEKDKTKQNREQLVNLKDSGASTYFSAFELLLFILIFYLLKREVKILYDKIKDLHGKYFR